MSAIVYRIVCAPTGAWYIGITKRAVAKRMSDHRASARRGSDAHLHRAMRKYGFGAFAVEILEDCTDFEVAKASEQRWIALMRPALNMTAGGDGRNGPLSEHAKARMRGRHWSEESRRRFSEYCKRRGAPMQATLAAAKANLGKPMSEARRLAQRAAFKCTEATRAKLAQSQTGRVYTAESRAKMSASARARHARERAENK